MAHEETLSPDQMIQQFINRTNPIVREIRETVNLLRQLRRDPSCGFAMDLALESIAKKLEMDLTSLIHATQMLTA